MTLTLRLAATAATLALAATAAQASGPETVIEPMPLVLTTPAPAFGGGYVGVFGGLSDGESEGTYAATGTYSGTGDFGPDLFDGAVYGLRAGFDHAISDSFLVGVVADFASSDLGYSSTVTGGAGSTVDAAINSEMSLRLRAGFTAGPLLVYGTVGYGRASTSVCYSGGAITPAICDDVSYSGVTYGAGVEYLVSQNLSIELLYRVADYGSASYDFSSQLPTGETAGGTANLQTETISLGINYRF